MKKFILCIVASFLIGISACVKQQEYPVTPHIDFTSTSKSTIHLAQGHPDSIQIILSYTDGDGDFGVPDGTPHTSPTILPIDHSADSLAIADPAYSVYWYKYEGGDSALDGIGTSFIDKHQSITGDIYLFHTLECPQLPATIDTVYFSYFIKDRAGHLSNRVRSPKIIVNCN